MNYIKLSNGLKIPQIGFGIHHYPEGTASVEIIENLLKNGVQLVETASSFFNEKSLGIGIKNSQQKLGIKREEILISTKLHDDMQGYEYTKQAFKNSLEKLDVDYIDIFQIRHPLWNEDDWKTPLIDSWRALEDLYEEGKIRAIGVSNFSIKYLEYLLGHAYIKPMMNQIEIHPRFQQKDIQEFCRENNIVVSSWASLNYGRVHYDDFIKEIAKKYNKTSVQLVLKWHIQQNHLTMTRATQENHIVEDLNIFDFVISEDDMNLLDSLDGTGVPTWPSTGINI